MRNLRFDRLELLSKTERKARSIKFHPHLTAITGTNDVGKSSVIKSLYWAFGAAPPVIHPKWSAAAVKASVTFILDENLYQVVRDNDTVAFFDADGHMLISTKNFTSALAPFMADLLDFKLVLSNRQGEPQIPPPAYAFLPFYIDQDDGWNKPLSSFDRLSQFKNYKRPLVEFHSGILPNAYYDLLAKKRKLQLERTKLESDRAVIHKAIEKLDLEPSFTGLELTIEDHEQAIEALLARLQEVRVVRQDRAAKLLQILDERMILDQQIEIVRASAKELDKDAKFAATLVEQEISCPTCGTAHQNDFANRYGILQDREACFEFLTDSRQRIQELSDQVANLERAIQTCDKSMAEIHDLLTVQRGGVTLQDVIESRGRGIASSLFGTQIQEIDASIGERSAGIANIDRELKTLTNKARRDEIESFHADAMLKHLEELDVANISADAATKLLGRIFETGSDQPRAVLAYFLALLKTIHEYSTAFFAPIVIDSPNQQDQDATNVAAMIKLILSSRPKDAQTILGTVSLHGQAITDGSVIEFSEKLSVLRAEEFEEVSARLQPQLSQMAEGQT